MTSQTITTPPPKVSPRAKMALGFMTFLLRRGWMGPASDILMVITTTGRKTGKQHSIPIGYLKDGEDFITLTSKNASNWYRNVLESGEATLEIKKEKFNVRGTPVTDEAERQRIFELYKQNERYFKSNFGITLDSPESEMQDALAKRIFMRFRRK